jgi:beta-glucosidase
MSDFLWGVSTSAFQIEGAFGAGGRGPSVWDNFAPVHENHNASVACDHYHRWREDVALMTQLGVNAYRFSIAWPRIQPSGKGPGNAEGLDFYDRLVDGLLERGIEPWLTLYHWDLPQPIEDRGGWLSPEVIERFAEYAAIVGRRLGDRVACWLTLNETRTFTLMGYGTGRHAPGRHGWSNALRAAHHAHLAHAAAVRALRAEVGAARIGIAHDIAHLEPGSASTDDAEALVRYDSAMHRWFLDPTFGRGYPADLVAWYGGLGLLEGLDLATVDDAPQIDVLGLNYYRRERIVPAPVEAEWGIGAGVLPPIGDQTANGWEIHPDGLRSVLARLARDYAPGAIAITENGATFEDAVGFDGSIEDVDRRRYLAAHLAAAADAIHEGVPLIAYFAWSLLDNYEWALGHGTRFGIVHVDFDTQRRTIKSSGRWYRELLAASRSS